MKRFLKFIDSNFNFLMLILINSIVFLYIIFAAAAPILKYFGHKDSADFIYFIYSFLCHQKAERSFHIFGNQMGFCVRDFFIFFPFLTIGIISVFPKINLKKISILSLFLLSMPMILDGGIQLFSEFSVIFFGTEGFYESTNFLRFITGTLFGTGLGFFFIPDLKNGRKKEQEQSLIVGLITFWLSFFIFLFFNFLVEVFTR